ncbi:hypothetical protein B9T36_02825 [Acinetobacter sp. ANC 4204]|uniref:hypothetical protein n=1 Tax=Acinetobacter sp. ANC 4204 TaxID=1977884 RepID=UPI000A34D52D|nr:hypothetical protein [Acinetobacter sp. ANC 4204]OTG61343.1 hypothetical protein B9T36_02825 [Acinetobacter sp. ANC 4204]
MKKILSFITLILSLSNITHAETKTSEINTEKFYDLFAGTIIEKDQQLYLHACKSVDAEFKLSFNHTRDEQHIRTLIKTYPKFWLNLSANAEMIQDQYVMTVDAIENEHLNQSCHLSDLLDEL